MSFFEPGPSDDELYAQVRDDEDLFEYRERLEALWVAYEPINPDKNFLSAAKAQLNQAFWQMYVAYVLRENGFELARPPTGGPDILIKGEGGRCWVEAVCPRPGTGRDEVKRVQLGNGRYSLDRRAVRLRYTAALTAKSKQHEAWVKRSIVAPDEAYIVAIGGAELVDADLEKGMPDIVRAVLGLGEFVLQVPVEKGWGAIERGILEERELQNRNNAPVAQDGFLTGAWPNVTAVMFSATRIWDRPTPPGRDMVFVRNLRATVSVTDKYLGFGRAYEVADGKLDCVDFRDGVVKRSQSA